MRWVYPGLQIPNSGGYQLDRGREIWRMHEQGMTLTMIGARYGFTRERARQTIAKEARRRRELLKLMGENVRELQFGWKLGINPRTRYWTL